MSNDVEDMEIETQESSSDNHQQSSGTSHKEEGFLITVSVKWSEPNESIKKPAKELQVTLQSWLNKHHEGTNCSVLSQSEDGNFLIKIEPSTWSEFQTLNGLKLTRKDKTVTITSITATSPKQKKKTSEAASVNLHPLSTLQTDDDKIDDIEQNGSSVVAVDSTVEELPCRLPVPYFWYMSHIYKEQLQQIEEATGVKITAEVKVTFGSSGDQHKALCDFTDLNQKFIREFSTKTVPIKDIHPEAWSNTKKIIQKSDNKVLVTVSSEEMIIYGPSTSQDAIIESMNAAQNLNRSVGESAGADEDTPPKTDMNINDPLVTAGLTVDEKCWKVITASYDGHLDFIRSKFGVDFNASQSDVHKDKVDIKVRYRRPGGNASMESHAARALLRLCQKIQTSPIPLSHFQGASGFNGSLQNQRHGSKPEGSSTDPEFNAQLVSVKDEDEAAGDDEDEKCCICMDTFKDKIRLKCKHEFCRECLKKSKENLGSFCPICKDVFGVIEGNQPDGQMTWRKSTSSLPGYDCGTIEINYDIPTGKQTDKHPSPGQLYRGINRIAFLPDNKEGNEVLHLLKRAFNQKLIFTVGSSRTTGLDNQVTWNDIHHKTSIYGGPQCFGYPDPDYLFRVKEELKAKGIK
ncbi:E3 ubiquitin-protein ligase DTX3L [Betta splendens]|uniref:E3 ubiquitin-protein ligase n=1 Tax=Betta splendens TaxID=158456 RepID=A0A6P7MPK7_BETSP|nr:E3 ubiquitin-protein ligase DTX3L [Betta splendens]